MAAGQKTGGRQKGTPNRRTAALAAAAREVCAAVDNSDLSPLDLMLRVMRSADFPIDLRLDAAHKAAPYVHARLSSVELGNKDGQPLVVEVVRFAADSAAE